MKKLLILFLLLPIYCFSQQDSIIPVTATYNDVITKTVRGKISTYITQGGESFSVGDTITLGPPMNRDVYSFINQNAVIEAYPLTSKATGSKIRIKTMTAITKKVQVMATHCDGHTYQTFISNFESAYQNGEVKSKVMSSDEALNELKKCKDKLDLGLISQEEYDQKKAELSKLIK